MTPSITILRRFCGPPDSANGGYAAGALARHVGGTVEVTLRRPVPLERPLEVVAESGRFFLRDGDDVVAEARAAVLDAEVPAPVTFDRACDASAQSPIVVRPERHPFPGDFACGTDREPGDGLRLFAGRVPGSDWYAVPWTPWPGAPVPDEIVWSALDSPSSFVIYLDDDSPPPHVLGRITARVDELPAPGVAHVIMSWRIERSGRKTVAGSAIYRPDGTVCARARATWIAI